MEKIFYKYSALLLAIFIAGCDFSSKVTIEEICFSQPQQCIYLKRKERGLNYSVVVISTSDNKSFSPNKDKEYVITAGTDDIFYKKTENRLLLYVLQPSAVPPEFNSKIIIEQIDISGPEKGKLRLNYQKEGLEKF